MPSAMHIISGAHLSLAPREEWPDADFDFPEEEPIHASDVESDRGDLDDDDWDADMDLGQIGGPTIKGARVGSPLDTTAGPSTLITIRPPLRNADIDEEDEEGVSTIKVAGDTLKAAAGLAADEDMEADFAIPADMTRLSLRPASLRYQSSRSSLEWGDKDHTASSSQSSDAYSTFGFGNSAASSPTSHGTSGSLPETETEEDDEDDLDGVVIPSGLFESGSGAKQLARLLEMKKKLPSIAERSKVASPDPEDDFEMGLVIEDDADLSLSRLSQSQHNSSRRLHFTRSSSAPVTRPGSGSALRPPSRSKAATTRTKSPTNPPPSSARHLRNLTISAATAFTPPGMARPTPPTRATTLISPAVAPSPSSSAAFLAPKASAGLRSQKSHSHIKPPSPPNRLSRKASLSSLIDTTSGSSGASTAGGAGHPVARYEAPTLASRAKSQRGSLAEAARATPPPPDVLPSPSTRTMPAAMNRPRTRPSVNGLFQAGAAAARDVQPRRTTSPLPPRPTSTASSKSRSSVASPPPLAAAAPKVMRKPKRAKVYGDGTELDRFDDLPTDRDQESRYRVQAKGYGNRVAGGSVYPQKAQRPKSRTEDRPEQALGPSLRRSGKIDFPTKPPVAEAPPKKKREGSTSSSKHSKQMRKPTLIRNLGGAGAPKVVGEMKWNPQTLRWEGNDQALRDFDAAVAPARPALITHLTGSSMGSPVGALASGARKVGNMIFDPAQMCWISALPPDEDEPDVFADLADDEDTDVASVKGGTIRVSTGGMSASEPAMRRAASPALSTRSRAASESGSEAGPPVFDRGSRASMHIADVDEAFRDACRAAEARHRAEMQGWRGGRADDASDRSFLYEIRNLATRKY